VKETSNERNNQFACSSPGALDTPIPRQSGHGRPNHRRVRDLHDFCRRLSFLHWEEPHRPHSPRSSAPTDFLFHLSALEQLDDSFRCETSETPAVRSLPHVVGADSRARCPLSLRHGPRVAQPYLQSRSHRLHKSFWNNVLLAGGPARLSRNGRLAGAFYRVAVRIAEPRRSRAVRASGCAFHVLAFCG